MTTERTNPKITDPNDWNSRMCESAGESAVFDEVEELVGRYPSSEALRNALQAVMDYPFHMITNQDTLENFARMYEVTRGVHQHILHPDETSLWFAEGGFTFCDDGVCNVVTAYAE